jgi:ubiquinone/menaquinone biosynthesis C-methylase UbiE
MLPSETQSTVVKSEIQQFWGELYRAAYVKNPEEYAREIFLDLLADLERMFRQRQHLAVVEMPMTDLRGKHVLEVGSGAGAHSALFAGRGAEVDSLDISADRVAATARKLDWVVTDGHFALQGDAEYLPFRDDQFDIVYSNGVLHHTPDTERALREVHRVLRPGGLAAVMLYAKHSFKYWVNLFLVRGVLEGELFRDRNWLGRVTEWMASTPQRVHNPVTKVFTGAEVRGLFGQFSSVKIRKNSFNYGMVPKVGGRLSAWLERRYGANRGGILVYGIPWRAETAIELVLGRWIGFGLNILAVK